MGGRGRSAADCRVVASVLDCNPARLHVGSSILATELPEGLDG